MSFAPAIRIDVSAAFLAAFAALPLLAAESDDSLIRKLTERFVEVESRSCASIPDFALREYEGDSIRLAATLRPDGTWPDIDYDTSERGYCPRVKALYRLHALAVGRKEEACRRVIGWWLAHPADSANWWWTSIGFPQALGVGAVIAQSALSAEERTGVCAVLRKADVCERRTGQNHVWLARVKFMRALLERNAALAREAVAEIAGEIAVSDAEGIRSDWCFHQHGHQPQFGNYGLGFVLLASRMAVLLDGTALAFDRGKLNILKGLLENGYRWIVWKDRMDISAMGRQLVPGAQRDKAELLQLALSFAAQTDLGVRKDPPLGFRYFDQSAYAVYRTTNWMASVRMATTSIVGAEIGVNHENVYGGCLCDGALLTYVTGREYEDITPLWGRGRHVPGITSYESRKRYRVKTPGGRITNGSDNVSGRQEPGAGVVTMELRKEGLRALKSWRFTTRGVECTGREISSRDPRKVITPVEVCWAAENARLLPYDGKCVRAVNGTVLYEIDARPDEVRFEVEERSGDFHLTHPKLPRHPTEGRVFSLIINHGVRPKNAMYCYRIFPAGK